MIILKLVAIYFCVGLVYLLIRNATELLLRGIGYAIIYTFKYIFIGGKLSYHYIAKKFNKK